MARGVFSSRRWHAPLSSNYADFLLLCRIEVPMLDILVTKIALLKIWNKIHNRTSLKKRILFS